MNEDDIQSRLKKVWGASSMPFGSGSRIEYRSESQQKMHQQWLQWVELGSNGVVWGEHGVGKTRLLNEVSQALSPKLYSVVTLTHTSLSASDILCALCVLVGVEPAFRRSQTARNLIVHWQKDGRKPVLFIDEAQNLTAASIEELRLLLCASAQQNSGRDFFTLSLCGDGEVLPRLRMGINAALLSRMGYELCLGALMESEIEPFLQAGFLAAGVHSLPVESSVVSLLHKASGGNMRKLGQLLIQSIVLMLEEPRSNRIAPSHVQEAIQRVPSLNLRKKALSSA